MNLTISLLAKLDYPSPAVMGISTTVMVAFIWIGGVQFKKAELRAKAERAELLAKIAADGTPKNP